MRPQPLARPLILALVLFVLLLTGCAKTSLTRVHDPDYQGIQFAHAAVFADASDLQQRKLFEDALVAELKARGVSARASIDLLPPTRDYTPQERAQALLNASVDAVIVVVGESGVERTYVPVTGSTTRTDGSVTVQNNTAYYRETARTEYEGGYTITKPWAEITTRVIDLRAERTAWLSQTDTRGGGFSTFDDVRKSYARSIAKQLERDHVFSTGGDRTRAPSQHVAAIIPLQAPPAAVAPPTPPAAPAAATPKVVEASRTEVSPTAPPKPPVSAETSLLAKLEGCVVAGDDGQFLGRITTKPDPQSIRDAHSEYGSTAGRSSIFNPRGTYGSARSALSAFNAAASNPPSVFCGDRFEAFLTTNRQKTPAVDSRLLAVMLRSAPTAQCAKDTDCHGNLVCEQGQCITANSPLPDVKAFTGQSASSPNAH